MEAKKQSTLCFISDALLVFMIGFAIVMFAGCDDVTGGSSADNPFDCGARVTVHLQVIDALTGQGIPHPTQQFIFNVYEEGFGAVDNIGEAAEVQFGEDFWRLVEGGTPAEKGILSCETYVVEVAYPNYFPLTLTKKFTILSTNETTIFDTVSIYPNSLTGSNGLNEDLEAALLNRCDVITSQRDCDIIFSFSSLANRFGNCLVLIESNDLTPEEALNNCCTIFTDSSGTPLMPGQCS